MAYNYFPATYQPYIFPQQMQQPQSSMIWVTGEQEAFNYPVAPNNAVALWDSSKAAVYIKQADASGKPTIKIYDLAERTQAPTSAAGAEQSKLQTYAEKSVVEALQASVEKLQAEITALKKKVKTDAE